MPPPVALAKSVSSAETQAVVSVDVHLGELASRDPGRPPWPTRPFTASHFAKCSGVAGP